ncbi:CpsD/CapB family tyrosine-protein kinase [Microvirga sp. SRT01]|jgi:capsular exopolysaccharide synthesis family protein|uniref:non-specific protein-tyrosine kinase n=1 Tax=Sphingomonas longa TaxID=2778730 RepID=A0ABS2D3J7_9SPHN|nr:MULTISPECIES: CpsD/CapB family tyrosine-protein kinase [Alphaproteobacteria]MBM6575458.1 CpsD/CapB family tyrosine-protein kinase [Sphingomonas sp. BT552]MBR7708506.1 CpsD/CapB family tyrosine-protein kinase [Microvirga sp. SRT01]
MSTVVTTEKPADTLAKSATSTEVTFTPGEDLVVLNDPGSERAESIGALRTHVMAQHLAVGRRSLALCSPTPDVGCTSLAANLAVALAEGGLKTLLIDADLRRPAVHTLIRPSREVPGLAQCLASETVKFGDAIQFDAMPNLSVMYAGGRSDRPQDLLSSPRFNELIDTCLREFDVTIVDTPPSNASADSRRIATVVGYSLLVVGRNKSFVSDVKVLSEELAADGSIIIGSVLTMA